MYAPTKAILSMLIGGRAQKIRGDERIAYGTSQYRIPVGTSLEAKIQARDAAPPAFVDDDQGLA